MAMLLCAGCGRSFPSSEPRWRCNCGGHLRLKTSGMFQLAEVSKRPPAIWRYSEALGLEHPHSAITLGEVSTPLISGEWGDLPVHFKLDFLCPTGSFKDRGSAVMVSKLREWGITEIVEDSSGNAGASVAAYAAAGGIRANLYIPASASAGKAAQIGIYGAKLVKVAGTREDTTLAALEAAEHSFYASHNWSPFFVAGLKTLAYEMAEQLGWRAPDWVIAPVGGGGLILGLYSGFQDLLGAGMIRNMPRLVAVQACQCAPVYHAWRANLEDVPGIEQKETIAEGISIARPVKGRDVLQAIRSTGGLVRIVSDEEIWKALAALGRKGIYVEPTAAAAPAALDGLQRDGIVGPNDILVVELTGSGLKATEKIAEHCRLGSSSG